MRHMFADVAPFRRDPLAFVMRVGDAAKEPLVRLRLGPRPAYLVADPDLVKPILRMPEGQMDKGRLIQKLRSVIGDSVVILSGDEHKRRRAALHNILARTSIEGLVPVFCAEIRRTIAEAMVGSTIDAHLLGSSLALRLVCVAAFGHHVLSPADERALIEAVRLIEEDVADEMFRIFPPMPWTAAAQRGRRRQARETMALIVGRVRVAAGASSASRALEGLGLSDAEMADEVLTLLLAGHHTTGAAVAWVLHALATVPGLTEGIAAEARSLSSAGEIDPAQLSGAKVSLACIKEVVRLYPSSWWFSRETKVPIDLAGCRLKPGTSLLISPWFFHRSRKWWQDPDTLSLNRSFGGSAYLPFGAGPRVCVGAALASLELQLIALELAAAFKVELICAPTLKPKPMVMLMPPAMTLRVVDSAHTQANPVAA